MIHNKVHASSQGQTMAAAKQQMKPWMCESNRFTKITKLTAKIHRRDFHTKFYEISTKFRETTKSAKNANVASAQVRHVANCMIWQFQDVKFDMLLKSTRLSNCIGKSTDNCCRFVRSCVCSLFAVRWLMQFCSCFVVCSWLGGSYNFVVLH